MDNKEQGHESEKIKEIYNGEENNDFKNAEDIGGGKKENSQVFEEKAQAYEGKEENPYEKIQADESEAQKTDKKHSEDDLNKGPRYSADYNPPYYVPNFTFSDGGNNNAPDKKPMKEKKKYSIGVIAAVCAVCVLLSATVGAIAGAIAGGGMFGLGSGSVDEVTIIKSDREITVSEIPGNTGYSDLTVAQVAALVGNSVVEITTTHVETSSFYGQYITSGAGSGVIFDQPGTTGYIVTNYHVIEGADEISVRVKNNDGYSDYKASYVAGDAAEDIAVISITVEEGVTLSRAVFANSEKIVVGEEVVAIGNPLGQLGGTVTNGIISALDREITIGDYTMTLLQTNAAINPGNSGGGLFNMAGELVGIVNAKQASTGIEGLGFAIPANVVAKDIKDILELGYVSGRVTLGIKLQYGQYMNTTGVFVTDPGSTDFKLYDRIVSVNDIEITTMSDYNYAIRKLEPGDSVTVRVARGGRFETVNVTALENTSKY